MAQLIQVIDAYLGAYVSFGPDGMQVIPRKVYYHWELIDTTPAEVAYFNTLGDNE